MLVSVPKDVDPAKYTLELIIPGEESNVSAALVVIPTPTTPTPTPPPPHLHTPPPPPTPTPRPTPPPTKDFANLNWDSARVQNAIAGFIIEKGYEYETDLIPERPGKTEDIWKSLLNGNIQVDMEAWLPQLQREWETALDNGSVIPLGKSLDLVWQSAFVVPTYMVERTPGLEHVQDLRKYASLFAKPGSNGKAVLWNCPAIWKCSEINEKQVSAYGLADVTQIRDPGSNEELFNKVLLANENQLPWLGFMWGPNLDTSGVVLTPLEEPRCQVGMLPEDGCGDDAFRVRIVVHPSLVSGAPGVLDLLRKWDFKESTQFVAEDCLRRSKGNFDDAAICYLRDQQAVWTQWMPRMWSNGCGTRCGRSNGET